MAIEKNINSRIQHKHDIEANWLKAENFIPKAGEIIVYDPDENNSISRMKIGDGVLTVSNLSFITDNISISGGNFLNKTGDQMVGPLGLSENINYGNVFPTNGTEGQIFFLQEDTDGNDLAEYRLSYENNLIPGQVVCENGDDSLSLSQERLQPAGNIISDTYGLLIGNQSKNSYPVAIAGRVLAYTYEPREDFSVGDAVCAGPNGTVSKMTRNEIKEYPERIIGIVSSIPKYETWGNNNININNRIWIKV